MTVAVIQVDDVIPVPLVGLVALAHQPHGASNEVAEEGDDGVDGEISLDHGGVETGHDQNCQVFIEILDSDRVAGTHEDVATML